ncbi:MAG: N-acetylglucosamine kinase [Alphaproteobacteria bacterium]|nr:N-acetylglucosamine kinase [Alphaproteobacteria bacterium]MBV8408206.1 N-acetylglucosamine kinase [Alphaproteobacteria bacterium]
MERRSLHSASLRSASVGTTGDSKCSRLFLGIDAGGTHCRARLVDEAGRILGSGRAGPANLTLGIEPAHRAIMLAAGEAFATAGLGRPMMRRTHAGMGVAGIDDPVLAEAIGRRRFGFASVTLRSDAITACIGAHGERDGGLLILGTGSQGVVRRGRRFHRVGGWGFMISDQGSAAVLGHGALRRALLAHDGVLPASPLTRRLMRRFDNDPKQMLPWARRATPAEWGEISPLVFAAADNDDPVAGQLVADAVADVGRLLDRMVKLGAQRIALVGGLSQSYARHLPRRWTRVLVPPQRDALAGAIDLARQAAGHT